MQPVLPFPHLQKGGNGPSSVLSLRRKSTGSTRQEEQRMLNRIRALPMSGSRWVGFAQRPGPSLPAALSPTWAAAMWAAPRAPWATVYTSSASGKQQDPAGKAGGAAQGPGAEGRGFNTLSNFCCCFLFFFLKKKGREMGRR